MFLLLFFLLFPVFYCLSKETGVNLSKFAKDFEAIGYSNSQPIYGKDGKVNMFDYIIVKSIYMGLSTPDEETFGLADVNNDGKVNIFDYIIIKSDCFA